MTQSITKGNLVNLYDFFGKLIPGGVLLLSVVILLPENSGVLTLFVNVSLLSTLALIPVAYVAGAFIEAIGAGSYRRQGHFHAAMHNIRHHLSIQSPTPIEYDRGEVTEIEASGGDHVHRKVWTDIVSRFELPYSYLRSCQNLRPKEGPESDEHPCKLESAEWPTPSYYTYIFYPILLVALQLSKTGKYPRERLDQDQIRYNAEHQAFQIVRSYLQERGIGDTQRFNSLYAAFRSLTFLSCILWMLFAVGSTLQFTTGYTSLVPTSILILLSIVSFSSIPVFFVRMEQFDNIRDRNVIEAYYSNVVSNSD